MSPERISRQISRAASVLRNNGPGAFWRKSINKAREIVGAPSAAHRQYLARKAADDDAFDATSGVDTGGIQRLHDLTIDSANARYGTSHIASDANEFRIAIESIDISIDGFTFVDLGSGKGRALMLALDFPFARIIGVEFARELHEIACANVERLTTVDARAARIYPVCGDASTFLYPQAPLVLFLFHPFDSPVMKVVARNAHDTWRSAQRPMRVVYVNPVYLDAWTTAGWVVLKREGYHALLIPSSA